MPRVHLVCPIEIFLKFPRLVFSKVVKNEKNIKVNI